MTTNTMKTMAGMLMCVAGLTLTPSQVFADSMSSFPYNYNLDGPVNFYDPEGFGTSPQPGLEFFGEWPPQGDDQPTITFDPAPLFDHSNTNLLFRVSYPHYQSLTTEDFSTQNLLEDPPQVPEPASMLLIGTGLIGIAARARKRYARKSEV